MNEQKIKEMAEELSKEIKSESDLADITRIFLKTTIEKALGAELDNHQTQYIQRPRCSFVLFT